MYIYIYIHDIINSISVSIIELESITFSIQLSVQFLKHYFYLDSIIVIFYPDSMIVIFFTTKHFIFYNRKCSIFLYINSSQIKITV